MTLVEPDWHTAHRTAHGAAAPLPAERVPLPEAIGRVLAHPLRAKASLPGFDSAATDGWAVAGPGPWHLTGRVLAGHADPAPLQQGCCVTIAAGAPVPPGTLAVLPARHGRADGEKVYLNEDAHPGEPAEGQHVHPAGEESRPGEVLIDGGHTIRPLHAGLAAAAGFDNLRVRRRPRVALLVLGSELLLAGQPGPGQVRDALGPQLPAIAQALGADPLPVQHVPATPEATQAAIAAARSDVILTTGGTAHGPTDRLRPALAELGAEVLLDSVAMQPGRPLLLARLPGGQILVALPGSPLAAIAAIVTVAWPVLRALSGQPLPMPAVGLSAREIHAPAAETRLVPVTWLGERVTERPWLGSGMLRGVAGADGIAIVPPGGSSTGQRLDVLLLPF